MSATFCLNGFNKRLIGYGWWCDDKIIIVVFRRKVGHHRRNDSRWSVLDGRKSNFWHLPAAQSDRSGMPRYRKNSWTGFPFLESLTSSKILESRKYWAASPPAIPFINTALLQHVPGPRIQQHFASRVSHPTPILNILFLYFPQITPHSLINVFLLQISTIEPLLSLLGV